MGLAYIAVSMPIFWLGLMLILFFSVYLGLMPITGQEGTGRLFLPAFTLAFGASSIIARLVRSNLLDVMHQEFVTTARSKGLSEQRVVIGHALRNALIPTVTMVGLQFGSLLGGAVIVETVFARQGIGRMAVNAILRKDYAGAGHRPLRRGRLRAGQHPGRRLLRLARPAHQVRENLMHSALEEGCKRRRRPLREAPRHAQWRQTIDRLWRNQAAMAGMVIIVVLVLIAIFAPSLVRFGETDHAGKSLTPPNSINWAGTDVLGRDVFSRIMLGTRISLSVGILSVAIGASAGLVLG